MAVWDFLNRKKKDGNDLEAVLTPEKPQNYLSQFLPEDEDKQRALARSLIMGGANMMAAGGPSATPNNLLGILGQGLAGGVGAYDKSIEADLEASKLVATNRANNVKLQQVQNAQDFAATLGTGGDGAFSVADLKKLYQQYISAGEYSAANSILERIQRLDDERRKDGMILGEAGYELAPGVTGGIFDTKRAESLGSAVGQNAQITTDQKDFRAGLDDPAFRKYELEKAKSNQSNISVNTAPKDGEIFKAIQAERENATGSQAGLRLVYEMKNSLPNAITGFGADYLLAGQKAIAALGGDASRVVDTETLKTNAMELAAKMKGELVGNQQISDSDMRFVQQVAAGDTKLDGGTIKRLVDVREKQLIGNIDRYNARVDQLYPNTPDNAMNRNYFGGVTVPENPHSKGGEKSPSGDSGPVGSGVTVINSQADYQALPVGAAYRFASDAETMVRTKRNG